MEKRFICESIDHNVTSSAYAYDKWNCTSQSNFLPNNGFQFRFNIYRLQIMPHCRTARTFYRNQFFEKFIFKLAVCGERSIQDTVWRPQYLPHVCAVCVQTAQRRTLIEHHKKFNQFNFRCGPRHQWASGLFIDWHIDELGIHSN